MTPSELETLLSSFPARKVLVIGDTIADVNVYCSPRGLSAETPTMVLKHEKTQLSYGGAACVFRNLLALGADVRFLTMAANGECFSFKTEQDFPSPPTEKRRYWCDGYKMLQVDRFSNIETVNGLVRIYTAALAEADIVVVADYRHGMIDEVFARHIVESVGDRPLYVSSQVSQEESNHRWYSSSATNFIWNQKEYIASLLDCPKFNDGVITVGKQGAKYAYLGNEYSPAISVNAVDTCGAGDAFLAAYALTNSLEFANLWAGLSTEIRGANPPTLNRAREWVRDHA